MSKSETPAKAAEPKQPEPGQQLTLTEFCTRLSVTVRRPELLSAFENTAIRAGVIKATEAEFAAQFEAFRKTPV